MREFGWKGELDGEGKTSIFFMKREIDARCENGKRLETWKEANY